MIIIMCNLLILNAVVIQSFREKKMLANFVGLKYEYGFIPELSLFVYVKFVTS